MYLFYPKFRRLPVGKFKKIDAPRGVLERKVVKWMRRGLLQCTDYHIKTKPKNITMALAAQVIIFGSGIFV